MLCYFVRRLAKLVIVSQLFLFRRLAWRSKSWIKFPFAHSRFSRWAILGNHTNHMVLSITIISHPFVIWLSHWISIQLKVRLDFLWTLFDYTRVCCVVSLLSLAGEEVSKISFCDVALLVGLWPLSNTITNTAATVERHQSGCKCVS